MLNAIGVRVDCEHLAALAKQVHQVSAIAAAGVEHAHTLVDISAEDLIEDVNNDLAELVLVGHFCVFILGCLFPDDHFWILNGMNGESRPRGCLDKSNNA